MLISKKLFFKLAAAFFVVQTTGIPIASASISMSCRYLYSPDLAKKAKQLFDDIESNRSINFDEMLVKDASILNFTRIERQNEAFPGYEITVLALLIRKAIDEGPMSKASDILNSVFFQSPNAFAQVENLISHSFIYMMKINGSLKLTDGGRDLFSAMISRIPADKRSPLIDNLESMVKMKNYEPKIHPVLKDYILELAYLKRNPSPTAFSISAGFSGVGMSRPMSQSLGIKNQRPTLHFIPSTVASISFGQTIKSVEAYRIHNRDRITFLVRDEANALFGIQDSPEKWNYTRDTTLRLQQELETIINSKLQSGELINPTPATKASPRGFI